MTAAPVSPRIVTTPTSSRFSPVTRSKIAAVVFWANLVCQMGIIVTGGVVRLTGSGLGCSTWPHCEPDQFIPMYTPEMGIHPLIEYGNRALTIVLSLFSVLVLLVAVRWLRHKGIGFLLLAMVPLVGTLVQALVGAVVVWGDLHPGLVSPHYLISPILIAFSTLLLYRVYEPGDRFRLAVPPRLAILGIPLALAAFTILIVGTLVTGTGPHSGDSSDVVRLAFNPVMISRVHAISVWVFTALLIIFTILARPIPQLFRVSLLTIGCTVLQAIIGYAQYFLGLPELLVALHLLGSALFSAVVSWLIVSMFRGAHSTSALAQAESVMAHEAEALTGDAAQG